MALEKECDLYLYELSELCERDSGFATDGATWQDIKTHRKVIGDNEVIKNNYGAILCILIIDEFIEGIKTNADIGYRVTKKGIAFLFTDTYVERRKRMDLDMRIKEKQLELSNLELFLKKKTFYIALFGAIMSLVSIVYTLTKSSTPQTPSLPSQEKVQYLPKRS